MSYRDNIIKKNKELSKPMDLMNVGFAGNAGGSVVMAEASSSSGSSSYSDGDKTYYKFTGSGSITFSEGGSVKLMLIGGGGSGASRYYGGGSGAGGLIYSDVTVNAQSYNITIGGQDTNSTALGKTSLRGGQGRDAGNSGGNDGGCGGGNDYGQNRSSALVTGQQTSSHGGIGFNGGNLASGTYNHSGGGGGLGQDGISGAGSVVGKGGYGRSNSQLDSILTITSSGVSGYIGGGGGACANHWASGTGGQGGLGGGGSSGDGEGGGSYGGSGGNGTSGTGSGAGASGRYGVGGNGGSGICVIVVG